MKIYFIFEIRNSIVSSQLIFYPSRSFEISIVFIGSNFFILTSTIFYWKKVFLNYQNLFICLFVKVEHGFYCHEIIR